MDALSKSAPGPASQEQEGATPGTVRNHNERLILSIVKEQGPIAGAQIARLAGVSAQTASVITRSLEADGLLVRGEPVRTLGKVGKPISPLFLNPEGALAFGLRIGRRAADMILMNIVGDVLDQRSITYDYPLPGAIDGFAARSMAALTKELPPNLLSRIVGIGVATPFGLWKLPEEAGASPEAMADWKTHDFVQSFSAFTDLPVFVANDAGMACNGEFVFGNSENLSEFIYFYIGAFVGGGLVLGGRIHLGSTGNAAAFGTLPIDGIDKRPNQLVQGASIFTLERRLSAERGRPLKLLDTSGEWTLEDPTVAAWVRDTGRALAMGALGVAATVDVPDIVLDGNFPNEIKRAVRAEMEAALGSLDTSEIRPPRVVLGSLGRAAAAKGAAFQPILAAHFVEGSQIRTGVSAG